MDSTIAASKATLFTGVRAVLVREAKLDRVAAQVSPAVRTLLEHPPLASEWVTADTMQELLVAIEAHEGLDGVQRITRRAVTESIAPILRGFALPMLRLFGATPHSLLSRLGEVMKLTNRGIDGHYERAGDKRALITFCHPKSPPLAPANFASWRGSLEAVLDFCDAKGTVSAAVVNSAQNGAVFTLQWQ